MSESTLDTRIAKSLLPEGEEALKRLLASLSEAARQGHVCIHSEAALPESLCCEVNESTNVDTLSHLVCRQDNRLYWQRYWVAETLLIQAIKRVESFSPRLSLSESYLRETTEKWQKEGVLQPEQASAIVGIVTHSLSFLTGGPGTGKTYTVGRLLRLVWDSFTEEQKASFSLALCAPTGKAASQLELSVNRAMQGVNDFPALRSMTCHRLLGYQGAFLEDPPPLPYDWIIVDESSMLDIEWMSYLLRAVKPRSRLLFLGDARQLPAVGVGACFADMVELCKEKGNVHTSERCMRTEAGEILELAKAICLGEREEVLRLCQGSEEIVVYPWNLEEKERRSLLALLPEEFLSPCETLTCTDLEKTLRRFRILSPIRKGMWGVDSLNRWLFQVACEKGAFCFPILITQNDSQTELSNGEIGLFVREGRSGGYALFPRNGELQKISKEELPPYEYAYCLSIHQSQGSEFEEVLLILPPMGQMSGQEKALFYTAVTRARSKLVICGLVELLCQSLDKGGQKNSGLKERLLFGK